jgi:hypothetical protein
LGGHGLLLRGAPWVEAFFQVSGGGFTSHAKRDHEVVARFPAAERDRYLTLYYYSLPARDDAVSVHEALHDDALNGQLQPLKSWLLPLL